MKKLDGVRNISASILALSFIRYVLECRVHVNDLHDSGMRYRRLRIPATRHRIVLRFSQMPPIVSVDAANHQAADCPTVCLGRLLLSRTCYWPFATRNSERPNKILRELEVRQLCKIRCQLETKT